MSRAIPSSARCFSAPGKLMLFGEYGVLEGGAAVVAAVDRRVTVSAQRVAGLGGIRYVVDDGEPHIVKVVDSADGLAEANPSLLQACIATLAVHGDVRPLSGLSLRARTDAVQVQTADQRVVKLGLGSSAASCAALIATLSWGAGSDPDVQRCMARSLEAHHRFQGSGSGADVAAAVQGGVIAYTVGESARPLPPAHLPGWEAVWLGEPASTGLFLSSLNALRQRRPQVYRDRLRTLAELGGAAARAIAAHDVDAIVELTEASERAMDQLGREAGLPIVTDAHRALAARARQHQLVTKPSGAGGGDISLVMGRDPAAVTAFVERELPAGLRRVALQVALAGVSADG